jgi:hypothetical protein
MTRVSNVMRQQVRQFKDDGTLNGIDIERKCALRNFS